MRNLAGAPFLAATILVALPNSVSSAASPIPQGQLPDDAVPQAYRIDLTVDPDQDRFAGHVEIT